MVTSPVQLPGGDGWTHQFTSRAEPSPTWGAPRAARARTTCPVWCNGLLAVDRRLTVAPCPDALYPPAGTEESNQGSANGRLRGALLLHACASFPSWRHL